MAKITGVVSKADLNVKAGVSINNKVIASDINEIVSVVNANDTARANADTTLQANIDAEATARVSADNANLFSLQVAIESEDTARTNADTTLQNNIDTNDTLRGLERAVNGGIFRKGRNENNYGDVGENATDLSVSFSVSSTKGATGGGAYAEGADTTASGSNSHAEGASTIASGDNSHAEGIDTKARSYSEHAGGHFNTSYTPVSTTTIHPTDRLFGIGNGDTGSESDAITILKNGKVGIGIDNFETTTDEATLQVNGAVSVTNTDPTVPHFRISDFAGGNGNIFEIDENGRVGIGTNALSGVLATIGSTTNAADIGLAVYSDNQINSVWLNSANNYLMQLLSNGNLILGTQFTNVNSKVAVVKPLNNTSFIQLGTGTTPVSSVFQVDQWGATIFHRVTEAYRLAMTNPQIGSLVYQGDGTEGVYVYKSTGWQFAY